MKPRLTLEANIKDDRYYLGIATKAYKVVQDTLSKYKGNIKKRGGEFVAGKPFHKIDKMLGYALSGADMLNSDFPSLSTIAFVFVSKKAEGAKGIRGGFSSQKVNLGGNPHKGVLVMTNLIAPFDPKAMDTRLDKNTFIHEFIHYLDMLRYRQQGVTAASAKYLDAGDIAGYYNTSSEFNAYFQEGQRSVIDIFKFIPEKHVTKFLGDFKEFQKVAYSKKWNHFNEDFIKYLDSKYKKKFLKRLFTLFEFLKTEFESHDKSLQHLTEGNKIKINSDAINKWAEDLRKLTKAYKSIGDSEDDPATLKRYDKVRKAFTIFANNFETWIYKFFLQYNWQGSAQATESWEAKEVREKAWTAFANLNGNFPEAWDYVKKVHKPSPQLLVRYREKTIRRYRTAFREGIKALLDYVGIHGDQERLPPTEQANIGPIKLIIHNHARQGGSEQGEASREKSLKHLTTNIKTWANRIKKAGFGKVLDKLVIDLDFRISNDSGEMNSGEYHPTKDMIVLFGTGMGEGTFTHELGHRFWYRELPPNAKHHWSNVIDKKKIKIERHHIKDFVDKYFNDWATANYGRKKAMKMIDKLEDNPETIAIYKTLHSSIPFQKNKPDLRKRYEDKWAGKYIPLEHISDYGRTNTEEAFAEAFKLYILKGPNKLKEWTLWFFKEIVRTGGASIQETKIQEVSMSARPKSSAQVSKMIKDMGYPGVKVYKDPKTKHYYFSGGIAGYFYDQTIMDYDLRINDFTFKQWWKEFKLKFEEASIPAAVFSDKKQITKHTLKHRDMEYMDKPPKIFLKENKMINEVTLTKETVKDFVKFAKDALELENKVSLKLLNKRTDEMTAACYNPQTNDISIYIKERAFADVCRSIAHELVHQKQNELGVLEADSGQTGSDIENEANSCAGIIMRNYGDVVENLYN